MTAYRSAFAFLSRALASTADPEQHDFLLDQWLAARHMATEWDALDWGFPPRWCSRERQELMRRARHSIGVVPLDDAL